MGFFSDSPSQKIDKMGKLQSELIKCHSEWKRSEFSETATMSQDAYEKAKTECNQLAVKYLGDDDPSVKMSACRAISTIADCDFMILDSEEDFLSSISEAAQGYGYHIDKLTRILPRLEAFPNKSDNIMRTIAQIKESIEMGTPLRPQKDEEKRKQDAERDARLAKLKERINTPVTFETIHSGYHDLSFDNFIRAFFNFIIAKIVGSKNGDK